MQDLEKLVDAAVDLRTATLKAKEQGIIGMTKQYEFNCDTMFEKESFQIYDEKDFREMLQNRDYTIRNRSDKDYPYEYSTKVAGLNFIHITIAFLFKGDKNKLESEDK